ncbi:hypothetical protein F0L68_23735 [Solihabitans fulvus]|uniref:Uncharacterized protein n=1 Tax=Solihabitans fulvus TaxID=1892852 RepID=A0A5B2X6I0_9PSEU|nr:hypothetical protein [Solihabitans fulvus]KAA2258833.1 hypothetical protein F0L68_23735 [Solihabitans fulvus]
MSDVPLRSLDEPFFDGDQGWAIVIWKIAEHVFVMQGDEDAFDTWIKIPVDRYLLAWEAVLSASR